VQLLSPRNTLTALTPSPCSAEGDGAFNAGASFSGDGNTLVYLQGGPLTLMAADGSDKRTLGMASFEAPSLSADGRYVLCTRLSSTPGRPDVWVARVDGTQQRRLRPGSHARWSPDGRTIAYVGPTHDQRGRLVRRAGGVLLMCRDGSFLRRLADRGGEVDWAFGGRYLVYSRDTTTFAGRVHTDLFCVRASGGHHRRLAATARSSEPAPVWSPDAAPIAFVRSTPSSDEESAPRESVRVTSRLGGPSTLRYRVGASTELGSAPAPTTLSWQPR